MKPILISIQPQWNAKILNGDKTTEVRKNRPNEEPPFKCYIYCTKGGIRGLKGYFDDPFKWLRLQGKVIGEFVCDKIHTYTAGIIACAKFEVNGGDVAEKLRYNAGACMDAEAMFYYSKGKDLYGWHISELKIYDTPKELGEFLKERVNCFDKPCQCCKFYHEEKDGLFDCDNIITRPPQSWCYVEELK